MVAGLESRIASMLGKGTAVYLPTGTRANHLAVRILAGGRRRVLVQTESHLWNDCGDCADTLSGLHLVPLAPGKATFTLQDVERAAYESGTGRVNTPIGAIQIESPVRRKQGERFDFDEMKKIAAWAREHHAGLHLDGARLFLEAAYSARPVKEYTALFDTVYVPFTSISTVASAIRLLKSSWPTSFKPAAVRRRLANLAFAAIALHAEAFELRFRTAVETAGVPLCSALTPFRHRYP